jgi:hypothetical protein
MEEGAPIHTTYGRRIPEQKLKTKRVEMRSGGSKANKKKKQYEVDHSGPAENGHFVTGREEADRICVRYCFHMEELCCYPFGQAPLAACIRLLLVRI